MKSAKDNYTDLCEGVRIVGCAMFGLAGCVAKWAAGKIGESRKERREKLRRKPSACAEEDGGHDEREEEG